MLRSNWGIILAALGCIAIAFVAAWLNPEQPYLSGNASYQEQEEGYRAGGTQCEPQALAALKGAIRAERAERCQEAEEQHRLQANDLIQQRRSADAADASAIYAYQQTRIGAWGLGLGGVTMIAAIMAALYARAAAHETKRSADMAEKALMHAEASQKGGDAALRIANKNAQFVERQVRVAERSAERQLRPYVYFEPPIIAYDHLAAASYIGDAASVTIRLRNFGHTPAGQVTLRAKAIVGGYWSDDFEVDWSDTRKIFLGIIPPQTGIQQDGFTVTGIKEAHSFLLDGTQSVFIVAEVDYFGGRPYRTSYRVASTGPEYSLGHVIATPAGNSSR